MSSPPLWRLRDLLEQEDLEPSYCVHGLLPRGGLSVLVGPPKVGKSTLARNLLLRVARGEPFLGRSTEKGPCLYYSLEEIPAMVRADFLAMGAKEEPIWLRIGAISRLDILGYLMKDIEDIGPGLAVIDPLFDLLSVEDSNAYAQVNRAMKELLRIARRTRTHILTLHHTAKAGSRDARSILGSHAIRGATDTNMIMYRRQDGTRVLETEQRYGECIPQTPLQFDPATRTLIPMEQDEDLEALMLESLEDGMTTTEWKDAVRGRSQRKVEAIKSLQKRGLVEREGRSWYRV